MKSLLFRWGLFVALGVLLNSCTQPGIIGSDLLKGVQIGASYTDTLSFNAYVQRTDSVKTYGTELGEQLISYLCGQFADPVFGLSSAVINAQLVLNGGNPPNFQGATLDSLVLILPYVASRVYGDTAEAYQLEVFLLDEDMSDTVDYYSNKSFAATTLIGSTTIFPAPSDSLEILIHGNDTMGTQIVVPQVRIRIDDAFAQSLLSEDTLILESDTSFLDKYKGIQISGASQNKGVLSFNLNSTLAGLTMYYHVDTVFSQYSFKYSNTSVRMVSFSHDYTGAPADAFVQDSTLCDSLVFVQGMSGLGLVLEFPDVSLLDNKIVNRAELEFTVLSPPEDMGYTFDPINQLIVSEIKDDGTLAIIPDVSVGLARQDLPFLFGGNLNEEETPQTYKMNLSAYFIDLKNGDASNRILITPLTRVELANRVVLCGPKHPDYPAKIKLYLTDY